jgi:voltage-gated sodium channel
MNIKISLFRNNLYKWLNSAKVRYSLLAIIILNAIILGMETSPFMMEKFGTILSTIDNICLTIFVLELILKLFSVGLRFFKDPWNLFDFFVITISLAPVSEGFSVLRALRILRVLRALSFAPRLRKTIEGFVLALPGMSSVIILIAIIFYIGAVIATKLFADEFPIWFGSIGKSLYSLFQIMTLESWSMGIVRPVLEVYPHAWMFFIPFILITSYAVVNVVVGLIVNSMHDAHSEEATKATDSYRDNVINQLNEISKRLDKLER